MTVVAAALLGLAGSGHCVTMCGPLVLAIGAPARAQSLARRVGSVLLYHSGRILTYAVLGLVAGTAGSGLLLAGAGRFLAVGGGVLLVLAAVAPAAGRRWPVWGGSWIAAAAAAGTAARRFHLAHPISGTFALGLANGLLPCGMVYAAVALAVAAGSPGRGALAMAAFGLGTMPVLAGLALGASGCPPEWRRRLSRAAPIALALAGLLLLARGLSAPVSAGDHPRPAAGIHGHLHP